MATNIAQFTLEMGQGQAATYAQWRAFYTKVCYEALKRIVKRTPVDTGRARGNWQVSFVRPLEGERRSPNPVVEGLATIQRGLATKHAFVSCYIANNVPYINVLEMGTFDPANPGPSSDPRKGRTGKVLVRRGYSTQAPQGMVRVTLNELRSEVAP